MCFTAGMALSGVELTTPNVVVAWHSERSSRNVDGGSE